MKILSLGSKLRSFTLVELLMTILIAVPLVISLFVAFLFVLRIQATVTDQSFVRVNTDGIIQRLQQDIRNTSSGVYNSDFWQNQNPLTGGFGNENADVMTLRLIDSANGRTITWDYYRTPQTITITNEEGEEETISSQNILARTVTDLTVANAQPVTTNYVRLPFSDLVFREILLSEFASPDDTTGTALIGTDGSVIDPDTLPVQTNPSVVAIEIRGRTLHRLSPGNTIWREVDAGDDGDLRNDSVGAELFGRDNDGDLPRWQYIYNVTTTFRNS